MGQAGGFGRRDGRGGAPAALVKTAPVPRAMLVTAGVAGFAALAVVAILLASRDPKVTAANQPLASGAELRAAIAGGEAASQALVLRYPLDPRARLTHADHLVTANDLPRAETELRVGLTETDIAGPQSSKVETGLRLQLISVLIRQGRNDDAKREAQPLCGDQNPVPAAVKAIAALKSHGMCS